MGVVAKPRRRTKWNSGAQESSFRAPATRAAEACLPGVLVQKNDILIINVDLDTDKVPYEVFDRLRREFHIDVTSISISVTLGGNAYRAHAQMM